LKDEMITPTKIETKAIESPGVNPETLKKRAKATNNAKSKDPEMTKALEGNKSRREVPKWLLEESKGQPKVKEEAAE
jgi:hypothetical protein